MIVNPTPPDFIRYPVQDHVRITRMYEFSDRLRTDETPCYFAEVEVWTRYINGETDSPPSPGYGRSEAYRLHPSNVMGEVA